MPIAENIARIHQQIKKAAQGAGREVLSVQLVAVSKMQPPEKIRAALDAGQRLFGENRVQEAQAHWAALKGEYPDIKLHLIGPLQTNKVKEAVALFDMIETLDREKLAIALSKEIKKQNKNLPCLVQVNTGEEVQKAGIIPAALPGFLDFCRRECALDIRGLMCIPPVDEPPALHFAFLAKLAKENNLKELSMGMSGDFEKAIPLGATFIRIGTGIFGER
ncbi:MAG TPA: YggS family pyridoxal phosphate-dependent enzyme [Rhodospirillaceae bacterium]|nr:YggS family pyridoxal phosphate-dependent enzyme [Rhodospirillaceae bacterium]